MTQIEIEAAISQAKMAKSIAHIEDEVADMKQCMRSIAHALNVISAALVERNTADNVASKYIVKDGIPELQY